MLGKLREDPQNLENADSSTLGVEAGNVKENDLTLTSVVKNLL
jgi:hypothetical protein